MFCTNCGKQNNEEAKFCSNCGISFLQSNNQHLLEHSFSAPKEIDTPVALIIFAWLLVFISFFPLGQIGNLVSVILLFCVIQLISSKNLTGIINGWIILAIGLIIFFIGFFIGFWGALIKSIGYR